MTSSSHGETAMSCCICGAQRSGPHPPARPGWNPSMVLPSATAAVGPALGRRWAGAGFRLPRNFANSSFLRPEGSMLCEASCRAAPAATL